MADMLNSSRDILLALEPTFALVLKLAVATVLTVAEGSDTAEIARLEIHRPLYFFFLEGIFPYILPVADPSPRLNFFCSASLNFYYTTRTTLYNFAHSSAFFAYYSRIILDS